MQAHRFLQISSRRIMIWPSWTSKIFFLQHWRRCCCPLQCQNPEVANAGLLHDGTLSSRATVCGHSNIHASESPVFARHFFHIVTGTTFFHWERQKLPDGYSRTYQVVTTTAPTWAKTVVTATTTTWTCTQLIFGRLGCCKAIGWSTSVTFVPNRACSVRIRGPHSRSRPVTYLLPVMPTRASQPTNVH